MCLDVIRDFRKRATTIHRIARLMPVVLLFVLLACNDQEEELSKTLRVDFNLLKLDGSPSDTFHVGEKFNMVLEVTNLTGELHTSSHTPPDHFFKILRNDSLIMTSIDDQVFAQYFVTDTIWPGEQRRYIWLAPTLISKPDGILLSPAKYDGEGLSIWLLDRYSVTQKASKDFYIVP